MAISTEQQQGGLSDLQESGTADEYCKACEDPAIIPIYPARIAWCDLLGDVNGGFTYPTKLGFAPSSGFCLRTLRKGDVFIYDETNALWSYFEHRPDAGPSGGLYTRYDLTPEDKDRPFWGPPTDRNIRLPYVADNCESILIAYTSQRWNTFANIYANTDGCRDALMTRVQLSAPSADTFSAPLEEVASHVVEFGGENTIHERMTWNALSDVGMQSLSADRLLRDSSVRLAEGKAVMIALHDPVGVALEIAACHVNRVAIRSQYLEANAYPIASGRAAQTLKAHAVDQLRTADLSWSQKRMFKEWRDDSIRPEHETYLKEVDRQLSNYDTVLDGILAAWKKFFERGKANPAGTKGSLQNVMLAFPAQLKIESEIKGIIEVAHASIASLSASQAGQDMMRKYVLADDKWQPGANPVASAIKLVGSSLSAANLTFKHRDALQSMSSKLLADLAMPFAFEVEHMSRLDLLNEINVFNRGVYGKTVTRSTVPVPIANATREILGNGRARQIQGSKMIKRGHMLHTVQVPTFVYRFDGRVAVSSSAGRISISTVANGLGLLGNALQIAELTRTPDRDVMTGTPGRIAGDPRLGLTLAAIETATQLMDAGNDVINGGKATRNYFVRGQLSRSILKKLMAGKSLSDDMARTLIESGKLQVRSTAPLHSSRVMGWVGRTASFVGFALASLDLMKAAEAWQRGDTIGVLSNVALGVGAVLLTVGGIAAAGGWWTGIGAVIGIVLIIVGLVLSFFVDDPVTRWLKGSYWGTARNYMFWDNRSRREIQRSAGEAGQHDAQLKLLINEPSGYDFSRYLQRELQEFHEMVYWPQDVPDPADNRLTERIGLIFKSDTHMAEHKNITLDIRFRLPNFIDGMSEFDARVWILYNMRASYQTPGRYRGGLGQMEVTNMFARNLRVHDAAQGILKSTIQINELRNADSNRLNNVKWDILKVGFARGWSYTPTTNISLPRQYDDHFFSGSWDDNDSIGGQDIIRIWRSGGWED